LQKTCNKKTAVVTLFHFVFMPEGVINESTKQTSIVNDILAEVLTEEIKAI